MFRVCLERPHSLWPMPSKRREVSGGAVRLRRNSELSAPCMSDWGALADPPRYLTADALRDLEIDVQTATVGFQARWPKAISDVPEIRMLRDILDF